MKIIKRQAYYDKRNYILRKERSSFASFIKRLIGLLDI